MRLPEIAAAVLVLETEICHSTDKNATRAMLLAVALLREALRVGDNANESIGGPPSIVVADQAPRREPTAYPDSPIPPRA